MLDLRTLVPFDVEQLVEVVSDTGRCVVVHEAPLTAALGAEVAATLQEEALFSLDAPAARIAAHDAPDPPAALEDYYLPSVERVVDAVKRTVEL